MDSETGWDRIVFFITRDAGKTFRPIAVPPGIRRYEKGGPDYEQDPVQAITAPDGDLAHLLLYGTSENLGGALIGRWESHDGGPTGLSGIACVGLRAAADLHARGGSADLAALGRAG